jgi:hypothetical protein
MRLNGEGRLFPPEQSVRWSTNRVVANIFTALPLFEIALVFVRCTLEWRRLITSRASQETDNISQLMLGFGVFIMQTSSR